MEDKIYQYYIYVWISKENLLMKQSKAEVIATKCLQHQCIEMEHYV